MDSHSALIRARNKLARQTNALEETQHELGILERALDKARGTDRELAVLGALRRARSKAKRQEDALDVTLAEIEIFSGDQVVIAFNDEDDNKDTRKKK